jgi:hypothetical protein
LFVNRGVRKPRPHCNCDLYEKFNEPNIVNYFIVKILAWAGHLARMGSDRTVNEILKTKPSGVRRVGISKLRSENGVDQGTRILQVKNWKKFAL